MSWPSPSQDSETPLDKAMRLQHGLISRATGGSLEEHDYHHLRRYFLDRADLRSHLPRFINQCSDTSQFWSHIKHLFAHYEERRQYLWNAFKPLIGYLEAQDRAPGVSIITGTLERFDPEHVHAAWQKALDRRVTDPDGAITAARTLLESVCKHILDDAKIPYPSVDDLPQLYTAVAAQLNLAPHQHQEQVFKAILGNCQSVVQNLAAIRNKVGDAHGQGRNPIKPKARHAELAVNLAGTMSSFLISTWQERNSVPR